MLGRVPRHELLVQLGRSSVMVHPSLSEARPMSIVEATTLGMPARFHSHPAAVPNPVRCKFRWIKGCVRDARSRKTWCLLRGPLPPTQGSRLRKSLARCLVPNCANHLHGS